jgi:hypothetical protein
MRAYEQLGQKGFFWVRWPAGKIVLLQCPSPIGASQLWRRRRRESKEPAGYAALIDAGGVPAGVGTAGAGTIPGAGIDGMIGTAGD